jgi:AcrR family transcriptional regulator
MATTDPAEKALAPLFPRLSGGPGKLPPEEVARHQRTRLELAMVEVVARHGFEGTTLRELVTLAGVSKSTFYQHFTSKEDCFLSTYDGLVAGIAARVEAAYAAPGNLEVRPLAALTELMNTVLAEPEVAAFVMVDSLTLGGAGVAHREQVWDTFERMAWRGFGIEGPPSTDASTAARVVIAGLGGVVYRRLRSGRTAELPGLVGPLVDWAQSYQAPDGEAIHRAVGAASVPSPPPPRGSGNGDKPGWDEPPDSALSRATLTQRERILRAAAQVVVERGYAALSIPAISAAAGTSNQTFYEHFSNKRDAFIAAYEIVANETLEVSLAAFKAAGDGPEAIGAGLRALIEHIAGQRMFARLAFFELPAAGPAALDRADATMDALIAFLEPGLAPSGIGGPAPRVVLEATAAGIWSVMQREIVQDRGSSMPDKAPQLTRLTLAPLSVF